MRTYITYFSYIGIIFSLLFVGCDIKLPDPIVETHTVSFNSDGNTVVSLTVEHSKSLTKPANPVKTGYAFKGWYSNAGLTDKFKFTTKITEDLTIYAKWAKAYTVTFKSNGGSNVNSMSVDSNGTITKPKDPARTDYTLKAWYSDVNLTKEFDFDATKITGNLTLYAKWRLTPETKESLIKYINQALGKGAETNSYNDNTTIDLNFISPEKITDMKGIFMGMESFNGNISNWDVSNVTEMNNIFDGAKAFNGDISGWNVSNVTSMALMFDGATEFNGDISDWDVSNVRDISGMFKGAIAFNGNISKWDVSNVNGMFNAFRGATKFNGNISDWDVSNVWYMDGMFYGATAFNGDISGWNVSSVEDMNHMFYGATAFNQDISRWKDKLSSVEDMSWMFAETEAFNQDISKWNLSSVEDMSAMFYRAFSFNQNLEDWSAYVEGKTVTITNMFKESATPKEKLPSWYTNE